MKSVMLLLGLALVIMSIGLSEADVCARRANGCSVEIKGRRLPYFYKRHFTPTCNKHDICYSCASRIGWSRKTCDRRFYSNLHRACRSRRLNWIQRKTCRLFPLDYYLAVRWFGASHFEKRSPGWCRESWVRRCM